MSTEKILVVEDDPVVLKAVTTKLIADGYLVRGAANGTEAVQVVKSSRPDLMILDLTLLDGDAFDPRSDGFEVLGWVRHSTPGPQIPVIIHTENNSPSVAARALASGVFAVCQKGGDLAELTWAVRRALDERGFSSCAKP